jgi:hypothetical protein
VRVDAELERLWDEFHEVVNMTSRELNEWLVTEEANEAGAFSPPGQDAPDADADVRDPDLAGADAGTGRRVAEILAKRKADLTEGDLEVMRTVVDIVRAERGEDLDPVAGDPVWRHRLMTLGHDPLKPPEARTSNGRVSG